MIELQTVTVSVPKNSVSDLLAYAAQLARAAELATTRGEGAPSSTVDAEAVRAAYTGGQSQRWRPFLDILASRPGEWIEWHYLCEQIDFTPSQAAGMLGAAERRCHQNPPYEKQIRGDKSYFRMPGEIANIIRSIA